MPRCIVDKNSSWKIRKEFARLESKFPGLTVDLDPLVRKIEANYQDPSLSAFHVKLRGHGDGTFEVWKYDLGCARLKKIPRESLRILFACLDLAAIPRTLIAICVYHKAETSFENPKDLVKRIRSLRDEEGPYAFV